MNTDRRLNDILDNLRNRGNRLTPQRVAIIKAIVENESHPPVEQIHLEIKRNFPTTSLATVYKTIKLLKDSGEILELEFGDDGSRYDGRKPYSHPHMICSKCGSITDLEIDNFDSYVSQMAQSSNFQVENHRFDIFGICSNCKK